MPYQLHPIGTRHALRQTFDRVAQQYDANRPSYPAEIFDEVLRIAGITAESRLLEIGCGSGHATEVFAARGLAIHALEMGENLAALARQRLARFMQVKIEITDFDSWTTAERFHLTYAATAWHWLNPATREQQVAALLVPSGWLAIWRNRHIRNGSSDDFLDEAQPIYDAVAPELAAERGRLPNSDEVVEVEREIFVSGLFEAPVIQVHTWSRPYTAAEHVAMLNTHSDHQLLPAGRRIQLFDALAALIDTRYGGSVIKDYATVLQMARLRS